MPFLTIETLKLFQNTAMSPHNEQLFQNKPLKTDQYHYHQKHVYASILQGQRCPLRCDVTSPIDPFHRGVTIGQTHYNSYVTSLYQGPGSRLHWIPAFALR